jgi:hypothetical protein
MEDWRLHGKRLFFKRQSSIATFKKKGRAMTQSNPTPPQIPAQVVPYATPMPYQPAAMEGAWREGPILIVTKLAALPQRCVKCNQDVTDGWRWKKTVYWHHPALALLILFPGLLIYAIVALCVRQKATVEATLCQEHRSRRNTRVAITWLVSLGSFGALIGGIAYAANVRNGEGAIVLGLLLFVVLLIAAILAGNSARVLYPSKMQGNFAWLKGAGPEYLEQFPPTGR